MSTKPTNLAEFMARLLPRCLQQGMLLDVDATLAGLAAAERASSDGLARAVERLRETLTQREAVRRGAPPPSHIPAWPLVTRPHD